MIWDARRARALAVAPWLALVGSGGAGCSAALAGPSPGIDAVTPGVICGRADPPVPVTVEGSGFAALVAGELAGGAAVRTPHLALLPARTLDDMPLLGARVELPEDAVAGGLEWHAPDELLFRVPSALEAPAGVFDVEVTNPDGQTATMPRGIALLPVPRVSSVTPSTICTSRADVSVDVTGEGFLVAGTTAAMRPQVLIDGVSHPVASAASCLTLPAPANGLELCARLAITVPRGELEPPSPRPHRVVVVNPAPGECTSNDDVTIGIALCKAAP